jgi:hypothetical protein
MEYISTLCSTPLGRRAAADAGRLLLLPLAAADSPKKKGEIFLQKGLCKHVRRQRDNLLRFKITKCILSFLSVEASSTTFVEHKLFLSFYILPPT